MRTALVIARLAGLVALAGAGACAIEPRNADGLPPEAVSLLGAKLYARTDSGVVARADSQLAQSPRDVERLMAAASAYADAWRFTEAIELYTQAIELDSSAALPWRYRGHRHISVRQFDRATEDLERAAHLDSTSFDIAYHLGLAHFLAGHWDRAAEVYHRCLAQAEAARIQASTAGDAGTTAGSPGASGTLRTCAGIASNDDARVAMTDWYYRALRRGERDDEAAALLASIREDMRISSNESYHQALLFYKALRSDSTLMAYAESDSVRFSTAGFALANWRLAEGDTAGALPLLQRIARGSHWPGFGVIAAEVELARLKRR